MAVRHDRRGLPEGCSQLRRPERRGNRRRMAAVTALRARAERAEAEVQRLHRVIAESLPYIDFAEQFAQASHDLGGTRGVQSQARSTLS